MDDLLRGTPTRAEPEHLDVTATPASADRVTIRVVVRDPRVRTLTVRAENLVVDRPTRSVKGGAGRPVTVEWTARRSIRDAAWVALVIPDGALSRRREVLGW